jgi:hypothetical protein
MKTMAAASAAKLSAVASSAMLKISLHLKPGGN